VCLIHLKFEEGVRCMPMDVSLLYSVSYIESLLYTVYPATVYIFVSAEVYKWID
jgi:hypothetical protein